MIIINWIRAIQFTFFPKQTQDLTTSCSCTIFFQSLLFSHDWVTKVCQKRQNDFSFPSMKDRRIHLLFTDLGINDQVPVLNSSFRKILIIWLCHLSKKTKPNIGQMAAAAQAYTYYCRCYPFYKAIFKAGATTGRRQ